MAFCRGCLPALCGLFARLAQAIDALRPPAYFGNCAASEFGLSSIGVDRRWPGNIRRSRGSAGLHHAACGGAGLRRAAFVFFPWMTEEADRERQSPTDPET